MSAVTGFRISPQQAAGWQQGQSKERNDASPAFRAWLQIELNQAPSGDTLRERLRELTAREEILRTRLHALPGMALPIQVIEDTAEISLETADWRGFSAEEQEHVLQELRKQPGRNCPLQVWLAQTANNRWTLLLKASASHLDLSSLWLVAQELTGKTAAEERLQYADYAEWKLSLLERSGVPGAGLPGAGLPGAGLPEEPESPGQVFWRQQGQEMTAPLLPGLEIAASEQSFTPAVADFDIGFGTKDLRKQAAALGIKPEEYLFAAWCILIGRLRGQTQLQLAWIDDGRGEGLENALGLFEQALPVQAEIDPAQPLRAQLDGMLKHLRLAQGWRDDYDNKQVCDLYFAYRHFSIEDASNSLSGAYSCNRNSSLGLDCLAAGDHLQCRLAYDSTRFSDAAIACLKEQWRLLLRGLWNEAVAVGAIHLQGEQQSELLTPQFPEPVIEPVSLLTLIERQAQTNPNAPALADHSGPLSYGELSTRANQLAHYLLKSGIQPGDVVGILLPRGNSMIVAMLAVLKAGGAYLPLDPSYPADRIAYMVQDSGARFALSTRAHNHLLPEGPRSLLLDELAALLADLSDEALPPITDLQRPAYLIYTSGSTGQPKAVEISHANLSHSTQVRMAFYDEPVRAYLLLSSFAFDSSVAGIFWTLAQGGLLVLPATGEELDLAVLAELIGKHRISHSLSLPSLYETLLDYAGRDRLASLSTWIVAGEACTSQVLAKHREKVPQARLVNEYGPTEATVWATADVLTDHDGSDISIGRPIPTLQLWLLNEQGLPAAIGEPGEIHLGGPTLSAGYRGRPEQTAQAFVSYPEIAQGARLYKTGDLARWQLDGRLSFLGRADHQVKIRGYRVELGEIERLLQNHSEVREAAVIAQEQASGKRLVAYVTDRHGYPPEAQALTTFLSDRLPPYMVPSAFVHLKEFPRTPNGKLDLKALPDPDQSGVPQASFVAPRTEMEAELAAICAEVLRLDQVGMLDSFFQIGGDSILSLQIVARANQRGIRITAKQVFECETVAGMAQVATRIEPEAQPATEESCRSGVRTSASQLDLSLAGLDTDSFQDLLTELESAR